MAKLDQQRERKSKYHNSMEEISALVKANCPIIWAVSHEEGRFQEDFTKTIAQNKTYSVWTWTSFQGLLKATESNQLPEYRASGKFDKTWLPPTALDAINAMTPDNKDTKRTIFLLKDFNSVMVDPVIRQLKDLYNRLIEQNKILVIMSPTLAYGPVNGLKGGVPVSMEKLVQVVHYELPTREEIELEINRVLDSMKLGPPEVVNKIKISYTPEELFQFSRTLQGLTLVEVTTALSTCFTHLRRLDNDKLLNDKKTIISKSDVLEFIDTPVGMNDVGGLDLAKDYLTKYAAAHSEEAKSFGVEPLKGILFTGVPGTGKSLLAKAVGRIWGVPLLRLDVGKVMTGLVGGSEGRMREVINQAEAMAPCILWLDEVEKSLSGTKSSNFSDGGTLSRVFGTLLTAMQDGLEGVTIIATANDITMLPPEFIRRFNEVFFVDLPTDEERWDILGIHLSKRGRKLSTFLSNKEQFLEASKEFTGAEIEKAVKDAIAASYYDNKKELQFSHILDALQDTKPIAKLMFDKIEQIRKTAIGQYRFSSSLAEKSMGKTSTKKKKVTKTSTDDLLATNSKEEDNTTNRLLF